MKILFIGDVVGDNGRELLLKRLPTIKKEYSCDVCIVNGENSNESGTGMTKADADDIFAVYVCQYFVNLKKWVFVIFHKCGAHKVYHIQCGSAKVNLAYATAFFGV